MLDSRGEEQGPVGDLVHLRHVDCGGENLHVVIDPVRVANDVAFAQGPSGNETLDFKPGY